jgi:hypothetical protein
MDRVVQAGQRDDHVVTRFNEVIALVRSPQSLLAPSFVLRVLARARQTDRVRREGHVPASTEDAAIDTATR